MTQRQMSWTPLIKEAPLKEPGVLWWADPVAALVMLPLILKEGWETLEEGKPTQ
ncbi:MAG: hypothetical protein HYY91_04260 [Candidatus Omnitrophica bacterium]|nr:hypothetical protein [Candidatus Omnitrophota bacterium]